VQLYAWCINVSQKLDRPRREGIQDIPIPTLPPETLARTYIYVDRELAQLAETAARFTSPLSSMVDDERRRDLVASMSQIIVGVTVIVERRARELDSTPIARFRWRLARIIHARISIDDTTLAGLSRVGRIRARLRAVRAELQPEKRGLFYDGPWRKPPR
jgi:hypothetical protein